MAVRDVEEYYYKVQAQYLEMKEDLADFEKALKDGYITEEKVKEATDELYQLQVNYDRLSYIMFLLQQPKRKRAKDKYTKANKKLLEELKEKKADEESVIKENKSVIAKFKEKLKKILKIK